VGLDIDLRILEVLTGFRVSRASDPTGIAITTAVQSNASIDCTFGPSLLECSSRRLGIYSHTTTGDAANVFSVINAGYWIVLATAGTQDITLVALQALTLGCFGNR